MPRNIKDLTGQKFNMLTAISFSHMKKNQGAYWLFRCDCGNEKFIRSQSVKNNITKSCGCINLAQKKARIWKMHKKNKLESGLASKRRIYRTYKRHAKDKNRQFNMSFDDFVEISSKDCFYCGDKPSNLQKAEGNNGDYIYNGIDRINNNRGYQRGNIVSCCGWCNKMKAEHSLTEFIDHIKKINKHSGSGKRW